MAPPLPNGVGVGPGVGDGPGLAVMTTGGVIGAVIHFIRFLPSPECELPWSLVIALLYFTALLNAYFILLWHIWSLWKKKRRKE